MDILTKDGIEIISLPLMAICTIANEDIEGMIECPIKNFDDFGNICVPELCEHYTER